MARKSVNTTIDEDLYLEIKILALRNKVNANDLLEEGIKLVLEKYSKEKEDDKK